MCSPGTIAWFKNNLTIDDVLEKKIVDIGSYDVNGSLRPLFISLKAASYVGIDLRSGPGVDIVCPVERLSTFFGEEKFDIAISSSTFEHVQNWKAGISNLKQICKPGGLIMISVPSKWPYHGYPSDFWRYSLADMQNIFSDCDILALEEESDYPTLVFAKIRKPCSYKMLDLTDYELYSMIFEKRVCQVRKRDFVSPSFTRFLWKNFVRSKIDRVTLFLRGK